MTTLERDARMKRSTDLRARAERYREEARRTEDGLGASALTSFPTLRRLIAEGHEKAIVLARRLRTEADAWDDIAAVYEEMGQ